MQTVDPIPSTEGALSLAGDAGDAVAIIAAATHAERRRQRIIQVEDLDGIYGLIAEGEDGRDEFRRIHLDHERDNPRRAQGTYSALDLPSFVALTKRYDDPDKTTVWVDPSKSSITAVLNDDAGKVPGWRDHGVHLVLEHTPEWQHWMSQDGRMMPQSDFASHLEQGALQVKSHDAAYLIELAQELHGTTTVQWRKKVDLTTDAVQLMYDQEIDGNAKVKGKDVEIPRSITVEVSPYPGVAEVNLEARFRWKPLDGDLYLGYQFISPTVVLLEVFDKMIGELRQEFPDRVYIGRPADEA